MNITEKYIEILKKRSYSIWDDYYDHRQDDVIRLDEAIETLQKFEVELLRDYDTIKRIQEMDETHY